MMPRQDERRTATRAAIIAAARALFGATGFARVSVDAIAAQAGVTKGGFYHHFTSKEALFLDVLIAEQHAIAAMIVPRQSDDVVDMFASAVEDYLVAASAPMARQILLVDGPAIVGWTKWREIDHQMFGQMVHQAICMICGVDGDNPEAKVLAMLTLGAIMEAAMGCAASPNPEQSARTAAAGIRSLLSGVCA
jgi:AcrR family transcriptional regulator